MLYVVCWINIQKTYFAEIPDYTYSQFVYMTWLIVVQWMARWSIPINISKWMYVYTWYYWIKFIVYK